MRYAATNTGLTLALAAAAAALTGGCTQTAAPAADRGAAAEAAAPQVTLTETAAVAPATESTGDDDAAAADAGESTAAPAASTTATDSGPQSREAAKPVIAEYAPGVPAVQLSAGHSALCKVGVGEVLPTIELPKIDGGQATLDSLAGQQATVVLFWTADRWMSAMALQDLARMGAINGVSLVGIAVGVNNDAAQNVVASTGAKFPQLLDADGTAMAQVGTAALPRIYVLDSQRRIAWFDIEYSEATRRELSQTLAALTGAAN